MSRFSDGIGLIFTSLTFLLLVIETVLMHFRKMQIPYRDMIFNYLLAAANVLIGTIVFPLIYSAWEFGESMQVLSISDGFLSGALLFLIIDFVFYWFHLWVHRSPILWFLHSLHHSSRNYNLSIGLRSNYGQTIIFLLLLTPLTFLGWSPRALSVVSFIHVFFGFWQHTKLVQKLGRFERILITPSHHRVHHGSNPSYIDKNFGQVLVIWDRIFGTFKEEDVEVIYGAR